MKPVVAYVDDDFSNLEFYRQLLQDHFEVKIYARSLDLIDALQTNTFDCFVFDIYLPILDGFQLLEKVRQVPSYSRTPVFFITSNPHDEVRISSYTKGAADFFDRMLRKEELVARMEARIKDYRQSSLVIKLGNLDVLMNKLECYLNQQKMDLTLIEFKILVALASNYPQRLSKDQLLAIIWGKDVVTSNNLNSHFYNLRLKLSDWSYEIENHRTNGYGLSLKDS